MGLLGAVPGRPPRKRKAVPLTGPTIKRKGAPKPETTPAPANDDRKSAIITATCRKRLKLLRAEKRAAEPDNDPEAPARVKAFFARMIRQGGALPPEKP